MDKFTEAEIEAIIEAHFRGKHEDPHAALSEILEIDRQSAKTLFYKYVYSDKWLKRIMLEPHRELWLSVQKLYKAKGRHHTQLATEALFKQAGFVKQQPNDMEDY